MSHPSDETQDLTEALDASEQTDTEQTETEQTETEQTETVSDRSQGRRGRIVAIGLAAALTVGVAGVAVASAHKTVEIDVDGETVSVSSFAGSVGSLLDEEDIDLGEHDLVVPGVEESLSDGTGIVIRTAEQIEVTVDGESTLLWTVGDTAAQALVDLSSQGREVELTASRTSGRPALELPLVADGPVTFTVDGDERTVPISGVADLSTALLQAEIEVDATDRVQVATADDGTPVVAITRIGTEAGERTESIDFETVERETDELYEGEQRVVSEGAEGERTFTFVSYVVDGEVQGSRLVSSEVTTEPEDRIIEHGTAQRPPPEPEPAPAPAASSSSSSEDDDDADDSGSSAVSGDVWAALAQCESGGNPTTNTGNGYYGMYQFSLPTWQAVGGSGLPSEASAAEQTERAKILQARSGWGQWPHCSSQLGLR